MEPVWLVSSGRVLASARRASNRTERRRGLIGEATVAEPLVLEPCMWIHTVGMKTAIEVVYVNAGHEVIATESMKRWRVGAPVRGSRMVVEAAPGSLERWDLKVGDILEVRGVVR